MPPWKRRRTTQHNIYFNCRLWRGELLPSTRRTITLVAPRKSLPSPQLRYWASQCRTLCKSSHVIIICFYLLVYFIATILTLVQGDQQMKNDQIEKWNKKWVPLVTSRNNYSNLVGCWTFESINRFPNISLWIFLQLLKKITRCAKSRFSPSCLALMASNQSYRFFSQEVSNLHYASIFLASSLARQASFSINRVLATSNATIQSIFQSFILKITRKSHLAPSKSSLLKEITSFQLPSQPSKSYQWGGIQSIDQRLDFIILNLERVKQINLAQSTIRATKKARMIQVMAQLLLSRLRQGLSNLNAYCEAKKEEEIYLGSEIIQYLFETCERNQIIKTDFAHVLVPLAVLLKMLQVSNPFYRQSTYIKTIIHYILQQMEKPFIKYQVGPLIYDSFFEMATRINGSYQQLHRYLRMVLVAEQELMIRTAPYYYNFFVFVVNQQVYFKGSKEELLHYTVPFEVPIINPKDISWEIIHTNLARLEEALVERYHSKNF